VAAGVGADIDADVGADVGAGSIGAVEQATTSDPRIAAGTMPMRWSFDDNMWLILLEALGALALLVLIVWWTMFCGRKDGERREADD
jgi:hypothetical protein